MDINTDRDNDSTGVCGWVSSNREKPSACYQDKEHKASRHIQSQDNHSKPSDFWSMGRIIV
jgi:hypothetical protein